MQVQAMEPRDQPGGSSHHSHHGLPLFHHNENTGLSPKVTVLHWPFFQCRNFCEDTSTNKEELSNRDFQPLLGKRLGWQRANSCSSMQYSQPYRIHPQPRLKLTVPKIPAWCSWLIAGHFGLPRALSQLLSPLFFKIVWASQKHKNQFCSHSADKEAEVRGNDMKSPKYLTSRAVRSHPENEPPDHEANLGPEHTANSAVCVCVTELALGIHCSLEEKLWTTLFLYLLVKRKGEEWRRQRKTVFMGWR